MAKSIHKKIHPDLDNRIREVQSDVYRRTGVECTYVNASKLVAEKKKKRSQMEFDIRF